MQPAGRGRSNKAQAFNALKTACTNTVGLLLAFVDRASSSMPINGGDGSFGTIAWSARMHLVGAGRVNLVNFSTCLHRLTRVAATPAHPFDRDDKDGDGSSLERSRAEDSQGTAGPTICAAGVLAAKMAYGMDPGISILEGSNVLANWAMDIGSVVGGGSGDKVGEAKDILGAIAGSRGGGSAITSTQGGWQR
jgi:hypothetical protein